MEFLEVLDNRDHLGWMDSTSSKTPFLTCRAFFVLLVYKTKTSNILVTTLFRLFKGPSGPRGQVGERGWPGEKGSTGVTGYFLLKNNK
jgi:hypothetical protein